MPIMLFLRHLFGTRWEFKMDRIGYIDNPKSAGCNWCWPLCLSILMEVMSIATTSFSRDGSSWFVNRYLPVKASDIFFAKAITAWLINVIILAVFGVRWQL